MIVLSFLFFDKDALLPVGKYREQHLKEKEKAQAAVSEEK